MCLLEVGAGYALGCAKSSDEGVCRAVGRKADQTPFSGRRPLPLGDEEGGDRCRTAGPGPPWPCLERTY